MDRVISILEERGLFSEDLVDHFVCSPIAEIKKVREELQGAIENRRYEQPSDNSLSASNFLASSSLRGESVCAERTCRLRKIALLARYSALYCDRVLLPIQLDPAYEQDEYDARYDFARDVAGILMLRPLIEAGVVYLVPSLLRYCSHCLPKFVAERPEIEAIARRLAKVNADAFKLSYRGRRGDHSFFLKGPDEYLEHGRRFQTRPRRPDWIPKDLPNLSEKRRLRLPIDIVRKSGMIDAVFNEIAEDATLQQFYTARYQTKYLTDRPGEAEFLKSLSGDFELARHTSALCAHLAHNIPLFSDVPIETIVRIRREDSEAFRQYRSALGGIVSRYVAAGKEIGTGEAKQIYFDELDPAVRALRIKARAERRASMRKGLVKVLATTAAVGLGIYSGILPAQMVEICKAIGGVKLAADLAETLISTEKHHATVRSDNLYFLLRIKEETGR